jgi:hypothetical protein
MLQDLRSRDVLRIWDRYIRPSKHKIHICVSPDYRLFLRINSQAFFEPTHLLLKSENAFLRHDSHVELQQLVRHGNDDIREAEKLGRLSKPEAVKLIAAVQAATTLTPEQKGIIVESLG